jgi:hypothetical protein
MNALGFWCSASIPWVDAASLTQAPGGPDAGQFHYTVLAQIAPQGGITLRRGFANAKQCTKRKDGNGSLIFLRVPY